MLTNFSRLANASATITAEGVSIIAPSWRFSSNAIFSWRNSSLYSSTRALASLSSSSPEIIGYISLTLPSALAQNGSKLFAEDVALLQAKANRPPAQEGVHLARDGHMRQE